MRAAPVHTLLAAIPAVIAADCALIGYFFSGEVGGGFGSQSYGGNDIGFFVDGELKWSYNDNHDSGNVAAICGGNNQPGDKCRHGVEWNGETFYYSVDFQNLGIQNCLVEWDGQGHWADQDGHCSVDDSYTFIGVGGGTTSSCGCHWEC